MPYELFGRLTEKVMVNKVILSGTLSGDPEMSYTDRGIAVTRFSLKTGWHDRFGEKEREAVSYVHVLVWQQLAEDCNDRLRKDMEICVTGELAVDSYKGRDQLRRTIVQVIASKVSLPDGAVLYGAEGEDGG